MKSWIFSCRFTQGVTLVLVLAASAIGGVLFAAPTLSQALPQPASPSPSVSDIRSRIEQDGWLDICGKYREFLRHAVIDFSAAPETWHDLVFVRAGCLSETRRDYEASILLEQALAIEPDSAILWDMLGTSYLRVRRLQEAIPALKAAIDLGREGGSLHAKLALAYLQLGAPLQGTQNARKKQQLLEQAEHHQRRAMALENLPDSPVRYAELGTIKMAQGDHVAAIALYQQALVLLDGVSYRDGMMRETLRAEYLMTLGQAQFANGDLDVGRRTMQKAIRTAPTTELKGVMSTIAAHTLNPAASPEALHEKAPGLMSTPFIPLDE